MFLRMGLFTACIALTNIYSADLVGDLLPEKAAAIIPAVVSNAFHIDDKIDTPAPKDLASIKALPSTTDDVVDSLLAKKVDTAIPLNFLETIESVKELKLPDAFKDFTFTDQAISENAALLQALQTSLEPISVWLKNDHNNLEKFFKETGFSESFITQFCTEENNKLLQRVFTVLDIPSNDEIYDEAIAKASERHKIADKYEQFDESLYSWLVVYISNINDINQVKGAPVWKVKYPGKISGVVREEGEALTDVDITNLSEQRNAQQRARTIRDELEESYKEGGIIPPGAEITYGYDPYQGFYLNAKDPITESEKTFYIDTEDHALLPDVLLCMDMFYRFSLDDDLAGVHEVRDPTGAFKSPYKRIDTDPEKTNRCLALEYLIAKGIITRNLKLPLALLIDSCF